MMLLYNIEIDTRTIIEERTAYTQRSGVAESDELTLYNAQIFIVS